MCSNPFFFPKLAINITRRHQHPFLNLTTVLTIHIPLKFLLPSTIYTSLSRTFSWTEIAFHVSLILEKRNTIILATLLFVLSTPVARVVIYCNITHKNIMPYSLLSISDVVWQSQSFLFHTWNKYLDNKPKLCDY